LISFDHHGDGFASTDAESGDSPSLTDIVKSMD
jgi:hypothetical protein